METTKQILNERSFDHAIRAIARRARDIQFSNWGFCFMGCLAIYAFEEYYPFDDFPQDGGSLVHDYENISDQSYFDEEERKVVYGLGKMFRIPPSKLAPIEDVFEDSPDLISGIEDCLVQMATLLGIPNTEAIRRIRPLLKHIRKVNVKLNEPPPTWGGLFTVPLEEFLKSLTNFEKSSLAMGQNLIGIAESSERVISSVEWVVSDTVDPAPYAALEAIWRVSESEKESE